MWCGILQFPALRLQGAPLGCPALVIRYGRQTVACVCWMLSQAEQVQAECEAASQANEQEACRLQEERAEVQRRLAQLAGLDQREETIATHERRLKEEVGPRPFVNCMLMTEGVTADAWLAGSMIMWLCEGQKQRMGGGCSCALHVLALFGPLQPLHP